MKPGWVKRGLNILSLMLLIMLAAAGCSSKAIDSGGDLNRTELIVAIGSESEDGFDPTAGWGRYGSPLFQSTLLTRDSELNIINDLATSYQISEDGTRWTVNLREDAKFSDGEPVTAQDVKFTFDTASANGSVIDLTNLQSVKADDSNQVTFMLKQPQSTFIYTLISVGIVPEHAYGSNYASHPIGSGPFTFVQWDRGQQLIIAANPNYYGQRPFFEKITFLFLSEDAAFAAAKAGEVDIVNIPAAFSQQSVPGMKLLSVESVDNRGIMLPFVPSGEWTDKGYPIGNDVTSDLAIRKAINAAVDREALVQGILEGYGTPAYSANDGLPWWNEKTLIPDADIELAKQILAAGGWYDQDGDGIVEKNGKKAQFSLLYPANDITRQSLALAASDMVRAAGIEMTTEGKSWNELEKLMYANAVLFGWGSHDPIEMYNLYSSHFRGMNYFNPGYYKNDKVDEYMEQALRATNEEQAMFYWQQAQWDGQTGLSALGDAPWAWLVNINHLYLTRENLDIGQPQIQPHGHGWPITSNIAAWKWTN